MQAKETKQADIFINNLEFIEAGLDPFLYKILEKSGFSAPTPIQFYSIKHGGDHSKSLVCRSKSGTGKTLAFLSLILKKMIAIPSFQSQTYSLIILPTRQLAVQVYQKYKALEKVISNIKTENDDQTRIKGILKNCNAMLTIGGIDFEDDRKKYRQDPAKIVIGTVGRLYELLTQQIVGLNQRQFTLVLDEGDKLFGNDQKFYKILSLIPKQSQWLVYSATYSKQALKKIHSYRPYNYLQTTSIKKSLNVLFCQNPLEQLEKQKIQTEQQFDDQDDKRFSTQANLLQNIYRFIYPVPPPTQQSLIHTKLHHLGIILSDLSYFKCLIFVSKKSLLEEASQFLHKFNPLLIHGGMSQAQRFRVMNRLNEQQIKVVITSDLLARGIDIQIDLVILFDFGDHATFWHRLGRTGRYGRTGVVVVLKQAQTQKQKGKTNEQQSQQIEDHWQQYEKEQVNLILNEARISLGIEQKQKDKEQKVSQKNSGKLNSHCWYGEHLTEISRWVQVDHQKQLQNNYRYYKSENNEKISGKSQNQPKQVVLSSHQIDSVEIPTFANEKQMAQFIQDNIFGCLDCIQLMENVSQLTGYQFEIMKYCVPRQ